MNAFPPLSTDRFDAVLFDLDGVLTATERLHAACWKQTFDGFLRRRADAGGPLFQPFDVLQDYSLYVDGKELYDGVRSFLAARGVSLPEGSPGARPDCPTGRLFAASVTARTRWSTTRSPRKAWRCFRARSPSSGSCAGWA